MMYVKRLLISLLKATATALLVYAFCTLSIDIFPLEDPDEMASFPEQYMPALRTILHYIAPIPLYGLAQQYDTIKRKELLATYTGLTKKRQIILQTLRSFSFWSDALCLLLPLTAMGALNVIPELILQDREGGRIVTFALNLLCYTLPLAAVFLYVEASIRRIWYREADFISRTSEEAIEKFGGRIRPSYGMLVFNIGCVAVGIWLIPSLYWRVLAYIITGANVLRGNLLRLLLWILAIIGALILWRALKTVNARRKLFKELRKICAERGYNLTTRMNTLRGLFYCTRQEDFVVETPEKRYAGSILPVPNKKCTLYFRFDYDGGGYNFQRAVMNYMVFFPRHKHDCRRTFASKSDKPTERILLLTREPADILIGDRIRTWRAYNGASLGNLTIYDATAFCHYIDRLSL